MYEQKGNSRKLFLGVTEMLSLRSTFSGLIFFFGLQVSTLAAPVFFVSSPSTNSVDWSNSVSGFTINSNVDFEGVPIGAFNPTQYLMSDGVTITTTGAASAIQFGAGPAQTSTGGAIPGEGLHPASNFLFQDRGANILTISFANPVAGAGFFTIDKFGGAGFGANTLTAFSGQDGTGTNLGSAAGLLNNFQQNNLYFLGVSDTSSTIGSIVWEYSNSQFSGDTYGFDNIVFASTATAVPELDANGAPLALTLALGFLVLFADRRKRTREGTV